MNPLPVLAQTSENGGNPASNYTAVVRFLGISAAGPLLVIFAAVFNVLLCFVNTRHWVDVSGTDIICVELVILAAGLFCIRRDIDKTTAQLMVFIIFYLISLKLINPAVDLKILHDIAIIYVFYRLGTLASIETGNVLLWVVMLAVLAFGAFELLAPDAFGSVFNVWSYYVNKGVIGAGTINYSHSNFYLSGDRGGASRTFFPGLFGSHRVSSVFLEPDSLGNFSVVAFAWCLSTSVGSLRNRALLFFLAAFCFVLADSRFASICCLIMLALRVMTILHGKLMVFVIPVAVMLALTMAGLLQPMPDGGPPAIVHDDLVGRLLFSARVLSYWGLPQWLGLAGSQVYTADTGYAYFINNLGLPLAIFLLACFARYPNPSREGPLMKLMMSVYFATALCVGASVFTIKTAALLWFLYGTVNAVSGRASQLQLGDPALSGATRRQQAPGMVV